MPNGGSDCCGTCWFNGKNRGEAGYAHARTAERACCEIRNVEIPNPFWTYCNNHPHRSPERNRVPIGPIFVDRGGGREIWKESPDTEEVRMGLLSLLTRIRELPKEVLHQRRLLVRKLISEFRYSTQNPFPRWGDTCIYSSAATETYEAISD